MSGDGLDIPNSLSRRRVWESPNDRDFAASHNGGVTDSRHPDWSLRAWMAYFDKKQAALVNELGWNKSKASFVWNGKQPYNRDIVNEIAAWLGIEPYELLMPPAKALALRQLEVSARMIAADAPVFAEAADRGRAYEAPPAAKGRR